MTAVPEREFECNGIHNQDIQISTSIVIEQFNNLITNTNTQLADVQGLLLLRSQLASTEDETIRQYYYDAIEGVANKIRSIESGFDTMEQFIAMSKQELEELEPIVRIIEENQARMQRLQDVVCLDQQPSTPSSASEVESNESPWVVVDEETIGDGNETEEHSGQKLDSKDSNPTHASEDTKHLEKHSCQKLDSKDSDPTHASDDTKRLEIPQINTPDLDTFNEIPSYMRGRLSYTKFESAVISINTSIRRKYKIIQRYQSSPASAVSMRDRKLVLAWKEQECGPTKGLKFVVLDDIVPCAKKDSVDMSSLKLALMCLRHCNCVRFSAESGVHRYIFH